MEPLVYIIILNWNGCQDTVACLASIDFIDYPNFQVIVVDNGSIDDSVMLIQTSFTCAEIIETGSNLGFSGGNNIGIKQALDKGADYILLLNNDTEVDPDLLNSFVDAAKRHPNAGALSARIYFHNEPDRLWYAGAKWLPDRSRFTHIGWGKRDKDGEFSTESETDYACGCAFFASSNRWREIGLLDDDFFLTFEETDWCYRALKAGYPSFYVPEAKVWHKISVSFGGAESPLAQYYMTRNRLLWAKRHLDIRERYTLWYNMTKEILPHITFNTSFDLYFARRLWWNLAESIKLWQMHIKNPIFHSQLYGVRDYLLGRFGQQPITIKKINSIVK